MPSWLGIAVNVALRVALVPFLADAILNADDPRFAGKRIETRGLIILPASLLLPALHLTRRREPEHPWWIDNLYQSIFALASAGTRSTRTTSTPTSISLPHAHGTGAMTVVLAEVRRGPSRRVEGTIRAHQHG